MATDAPTALAQAARGFVVSAAGCGKTEAIAQAVGLGSDRRQLILTHTHAGVRALRERLAKYKVPTKRYHVDTIAGWALKYAAGYPKLSELIDSQSSGNGWAAVYDAAVRVLRSSAVKQVVAETYGGLYVDEYQDCTKRQHRLVVGLAEVLPCRILGDPLQGIFGFKDELVDWPTDVEPYFERLPDLTTPWRWLGRNPELGRRLMQVRTALTDGDTIDLRAPPVLWRSRTPMAQRNACLDAARRDGSVVAIHKWPASCHSLASKLNGRFTAMEEMDCDDLMQWADKIGTSSGAKRATYVVEFAAKCMTKISTELGPVRAKLKQGVVPDINRLKKHRDVAKALGRVAAEPSLEAVPEAMELIAGITGRVLYRRELWREMARALELHLRDPQESLRDTAWRSRDRARHAGRIVERRTVSRTLLVKGLEFDHAVVLDAAEHDAKNLYVAMTRGARSLFVLSAEPRLTYRVGLSRNVAAGPGEAGDESACNGITGGPA